jgi:hypothetical protein
MSKQFNLFWGDSDDPIMFESLRKSFGEFSAVLERGTMEDLAPRKVADIDIFRGLKRRTRRPGTYHYFVLQDDIPRLTLTEVKPGLFMVEARRSPVIEFSPSKEKEGDRETLILGRFYFAFTKDENLNRRYEAFVRRLRKMCTRIPDSGFMWSMASGSNYRFLSDGITRRVFHVRSGTWSYRDDWRG